jgi:hypothetical protein
MEEAVVGGLGPESSEAPVAPTGKLGHEASIIEGSSATDMDDANFIYDCTHFHKYKAYISSGTTTQGTKSSWREGS